MAKFHYRESPSPSQKKAFASYLSEDEELILVTGFSGAHLRNQFAMYTIFPGIIFGLLGVGVGLILGFDKVWIVVLSTTLMVITALLKTLHLHHANRYLLTTRRVMIKQGVFSVKLSAALFDKITHIEVDQTLLDRLLHHGHIIINTAGMNKVDFVLKYVDYPMEIKNLLERLINREREQFGVKGRVVETIDGEII